MQLLMTGKRYGGRLAVLVALVLAACGSVDPAAELAAAQASFTDGDFRRAAVHIGNVLQADPRNAEARVLRGQIALALGDYRAALAEFNAAFERGASMTDLSLGLAEALLHTGDVAGARARLAEAEADHADEQDYWALRAEAAISDGAIDATTAALERAEALGEPTVRIYIVRASVALARNDMAGAEASLDEAAERFSGEPRIEAARGQLYQRSDRLDAAGRALRRAADGYRARGADAAEATILLALVQVSLATNDAANASQAAARLAEIAPDSGVSLYVQGLVEYQAGRFDEAARLVQGAVNAQPDTPSFVALLGAVHLALGNLGQAEQYLQRAIRLAPGDPAASKLLAETRLRQRRPEAALDVLRPLESAGSEDAQIGVLTGVASIQAGNTEEGVLHLERAVALRPDDQTIQLELARAYLAAGRSEEASRLLGEGFAEGNDAPELEAALIRLFAGLQSRDTEASEQAVESLVARFADEPRALTAAAVYHVLEGRPDEADALLERAVEADAAYAPARLLRADRLLQQGLTDEAEAELLDAEARAPNLQTQMALVQIYLRAGRLDEAEPLLEAAARSAPDDPRVNAARGVLALARGATEDAVRHLSAAQSARPDQIGIGLALAQAQIASGNPGAARATIATQLQRAPESLPLRSALASVELRLGNVDAALAIANALQAEYPELSTGYVIEGDAAIARRQYGAAAETLEEAFAREPSWEIRGRWINALQLAGREDDVLQQYLLAVDDDPANVVALNNAAWILHERGRYDEALPLAERANRAVPDNAAILDTLGWILVGAERAEDAIPHLERAAGMAPEAAEIRYHLATAQARAGHVTEARDELQRLLAGDRQFEQRAAAEELLETL